MIFDIANLINYASGVMSLLFGIVYLIKPPFLSYHQQAAPSDSAELEGKIHTLVRALMRSISGGAIGFGFIIIILQHQFAKSLHNWIPITMLVSGGIIASTTLYAMLLIRTKSSAKPSVIAVLTSVILLMVGYLLNKYIQY